MRLVKDADIVVTGEGRLDSQTAMGKAPVGVARLAKQYHAKVIAFAGGVTEDAGTCNEEGIDAFFPIVRGAQRWKRPWLQKKQSRTWDWRLSRCSDFCKNATKRGI